MCAVELSCAQTCMQILYTRCKIWPLFLTVENINSNGDIGNRSIDVAFCSDVTRDFALSLDLSYTFMYVLGQAN